MACVESFAKFDDESFALRLQLEEIESQRELQTGKWVEGQPPDFVLAFDDFQAELEKAIFLVEDLKLAHSIARAVDSDAAVIEELRAEETQSAQDRDLALGLNQSGHRPAPKVGNLPEEGSLRAESVDWDYVLRATEASTFSDETCSTVAGPSTHYTQHQRAVLERLPQLKVECSVCGEHVYPHAAVRLECDDNYCRPCLKSFFLRVTKDESLFPPKCHRQPIGIAIIKADLSVEELAAYKDAEVEFTSSDRVYCAEPECAKFIPKPHRTPDHASCNACGTQTCMHCKNLAHEGFCPADEARQSLLRLAAEEGWQSCFGCGRMVSRSEGCNHMTCRCDAEWCYRCGIKWKKCSCSDWEVDQLNLRAQRVVDREARVPLEPAFRQERVRRVEEELRQNHECRHSGKFRKIEGFSRRGRACEMCGTRHWKYLLSCRQCHLLACEDCRRHRV